MIAFLIIRTEMAMFDLKEGFCSNSWGTAKRFCCAPHRKSGAPEEICGDWIEWGQFFKPRDRTAPKGQFVFGEAEFLAYGAVAVSQRLIHLQSDHLS